MKLQENKFYNLLFIKSISIFTNAFKTTTIFFIVFKNYDVMRSYIH